MFTNIRLELTTTSVLITSIPDHYAHVGDVLYLKTPPERSLMLFKMCRRFTDDNMRTFNCLMKRVGKMFLVLLTLMKLLVAFNLLLATILTLHSL